MTNLEPLPPASDPPTSVRAWGLSWIRTFVPLVWGFVLTFAATRIPSVYALLDTPAVYALVEGMVTAVWYGLFRWLEQHLPPWLTRFVLGADTAPVYPRPLAIAHEPMDEEWRP